MARIADETSAATASFFAIVYRGTQLTALPPGRILRHQALNDIVARAFTSTEKPVLKEPAGLVSGSGKRSDGATSLPWRDGKLIAWDVTVATTLAESYLAASSSRCGSAAELISARKEAKYHGLPSAYRFIPLAFENLGPQAQTLTNSSATWDDA